jgi:predicted alpha/beta hydrolase
LQDTSPATSASQSVSIPAPDGACLTGTLYTPAGHPRAAIVIHGGTAISQYYYANFAAWLAGTHGVAVLTYDYRDYGASATGPMLASRATMAQWGVIDQSAALDHLIALYPALPIIVIGHSLGGLFLQFHASIGRVARAVTVASGTAHWLGHPLHAMPAVAAFWWLIGPAATVLCGYLPGRHIGLGADAPAGVYWQWRRWCTSRGFYSGDFGRALPVPDPNVTLPPLTMFAISDDVFVTPSAVAGLERFYPGASIERVLITPASTGVKHIGHMGVFTQRCAGVWPLLAEKALAGL